MELAVMDTTLTFSEAYSLLKKKEERDAQSRSKRAERLSYISTQEELDNIMNKVKNILEDNSPSALKTIKTLLATITESFVPQVTLWRDQSNLNLLHYAIINNKPDVVNYFLADTSFFPKSHAPYLNPYAHLAALLGHKECLRVILLFRPGDFFKISQPAQFLKLPDEYLRKLKVKESVKNNFLEKIKALSDGNEDAKIAQINVENMMAIMEDEKPEKRTKYSLSRKFPQSTAQVKHKSHDTNYPGINKCRPSVSKAQSKQNDSRLLSTLASLPERKLSAQRQASSIDSHTQKESVCLQENKEATKIKLPRLQNVLTVYWNTFPDDEPGILNGAGSPVQVQYAESYKANRVFDLKNQNKLMESTHNDSFGMQSAGRLRWNVSASKREFTDHGKTKGISRSSTALGGEVPKSWVKNERIDIGVRGKKKYKEFRIKIDHREIREKDDAYRCMNKTPLTISAERGHLDCVQFLLDQVILKTNPLLATKEPLTLATKARSPEAILLLVEKKMSRWDYQSAVLVAIRELYPDCLTALLTISGKERSSLFDGVNLFHVLYAQSLLTNYRYELMPEMTRVLIGCKENVNAHNIPRTYPMYTLISCAFNISVMKQIYYYLECLTILLEAKANPHYSEEKAEKDSAKSASLSFTRKSFTSAIHCILESGKNSLDFFEKPYWSKLLVKKFITTIETYDKTKRQVLNDVLFDYIKYTNVLGLDKHIIKSLLRYGANPDSKRLSKYSVNTYFDNILPYLTKFEVINSYDHYQKELGDLMHICRWMSPRCLNEALKIFLDEHLLASPSQALPVCRYFSYLMNEMVRSPRSLLEMTSQQIWLCVGRNKIRAKTLALSDELIAVIIP